MGAAGPDSGLTTEHLKSHLQKYRLNYERSRAEFLEFYDHSAKKNLKRRRKNGNKPGEHNTMFVFPISHKKQKGAANGDSDDSDDSDEDGAGDTSMSDTTLEHTTPRGSSAGVALLERAGSFTSMMQDPKDPISAAVYAHRSQQQLQNQMVSDRASYSNNNSNQSNGAPSTQAIQAAAYVANQRKASMAGNSISNNSSVTVMNNRAMAAAAAAAAFQYPVGLPMSGASGSGDSGNAGGQLGELSDPQWNILTSLMSPHIAGMNGGGVMPTREGSMNDGGGDQFQLQDEPNDLQVQMHLAMQAQMNLHRQMLTRKVEVSQHLINSQRDGNNNNGGNNSNFGLAWGGNAAAAQQQQQHHHQQQQQQQRQQYYHPDQQQQQQQQRAAAAAARQVLANSSHHPQMQMNLAASAGVSQTPRPSLAPRTSNMAATTSASMSTALSANSSLGMGNTYAASGQRASSAAGHAIQPVDVVNALLHDNNGADGTLGFDKNTVGPAAGGPPAVDDDSLDLYRWDRIDLNVELDDDDLFGFLKS